MKFDGEGFDYLVLFRVEVYCIFFSGDEFCFLLSGKVFEIV